MIDTPPESRLSPPYKHVGTIFGVLDIRHDPREVSRAREWITRRINETITFPLCIARDGVENIELCASEVISNALIHADGGQPNNTITIVMIYTVWIIRVEVIDPGSKLGHEPHIREIAPDSESGGRGLKIVDALSEKWGHYADSAGRTVWFEMEY